MTEETQQKILKAVKQMFDDLSSWMQALGVSLADVMPLYSAIIEESGVASKLLVDKSKQLVPFSSEFVLRQEQFVYALTWVRTEEFAAWLLAQPEPTPEELNKIMIALKDSLPNLRQHFLQAGQNGPRYRRGGRPKELDNPEIRRKIREEIKSLRGPGTKLEDLFERFAQKYKVSKTTIKRIWQEKPEKEP